MKLKTPQKPLIARVLEIAPECPTNKLIRTRLKTEGYSLREIEGHFIGKSFRTQLKKMRTLSLCDSSTSERGVEADTEAEHA